MNVPQKPFRVKEEYFCRTIDFCKIKNLIFEVKKYMLYRYILLVSLLTDYRIIHPQYSIICHYRYDSYFHSEQCPAFYFRRKIMIPDTCHLLEYTVLEITIYQCRMPIDILCRHFYRPLCVLQILSIKK